MTWREDIRRLAGSEAGAREVTATISQCVTDCTWLVGRGYPDVALLMRDAFCREWDCPELYWNGAVDDLVDDVARRSVTPETTTMQLDAVRFTEVTA
jgi:hypothetical protein